jgi:phage terminase large subunit-like protein
MPMRQDWRVLLMLAGRGFGKTRTGAEWVNGMARHDPQLRIALVAASLDEARAVMVEGESGILNCAIEGDISRWFRDSGKLVWASGARAFLYSGAAPEKLRGPEHHIAWYDELAKWRRAEATWDNLMLGLRLGSAPRLLVTTTPRPIPLLRRIRADPATVTTGGGTGENPYLPAEFVAAMKATYGGTRLGRQELNGELIEDVEGALWTRDLIEASRVLDGRVSAALDPARTERTFLKRVVIGVDPPGSASGDACGIVAVGLGHNGIGYVIGDHSVRGRSPEGWARAVAEAAERHGADRVVAEKNMGGEMVESVLRGAALHLPVTLVTASRGKTARAEPVAALFERGAARFAGAFPELEDELAGLCAGGAYEGPGRSPDRADAMVWALTELMLGKEAPVPRVRCL